MNSGLKEIVVATANTNKLKEIKACCADLPLSFVSFDKYINTLEDIPETGNTFEENAGQKALWVWEQLHLWTLADDSGLEVPALSGEPGILSARYAGQPKNDRKNIEKLLRRMKDLDGEERIARFVCVLFLKAPDGSEYIIRGECTGKIIKELRGADGFGYDPVFVPDGFDCTFAEMDLSIKNRISHRGRALQKLGERLNELFR